MPLLQNYIEVIIGQNVIIAFFFNSLISVLASKTNIGRAVVALPAKTQIKAATRNYMVVDSGGPCGQKWFLHHRLLS